MVLSSKIIKVNFYTLMFWLVSVMFLFPPLVTVTPLLEERFNPVIVNQKTTILEKYEDRIIFEVEFTKRRECKLEAVDWVAIRNGRRYSMSVITPSGLQSMGKTYYESGTFVAGPYVAHLPILSRPPEYIKAIVYYNCHMFYLVKEEFAEFKVE